VNPVCPVKVHTGKVNVVALSLDGKWVVSGSEDTRLKIWDADTGAKVSILECARRGWRGGGGLFRMCVQGLFSEWL